MLLPSCRPCFKVTPVRTIELQTLGSRRLSHFRSLSYLLRLADGGAFNMFQNWLAGPKDTYGIHQDNYVPVNLGDKLSFSMSITADGKSWDIDANGAKNNYPFHDDFTQAVFCGEFYESAWNFGELRFDNVQIVVQGSDASFCVEGGQSITGGATAQFGAICEFLGLGSQREDKLIQSDVS